MDPLTIVIALAALTYVVYRQFVGRFVQSGGGFVLPGVLVVYGLVQIVQAHATWNGVAIAFGAVELALVVGLGVVRAQAIRLSLVDGYLYRQGGGWTLLWWLVSIAARVGVELLASHTSAGPAIAATLMFSFGASLVAQNLVLAARVRADGRPLRPADATRRGGRRLDRSTLGR